MDADLLKTIARVRRAMPRNADVMALCDALEKRLIATPPDNGTASKFDKRAYMRDYMRKKRAKSTT